LFSRTASGSKRFTGWAIAVHDNKNVNANKLVFRVVATSISAGPQLPD
jgi:hypothetical protein